MKEPTKYSEFWDFYVSEHSNRLNRRLHFIGSSLAVILLILFLWASLWYYLPLCLVIGYGFAWIGHFFIEKNKPASFKYPLWSFISDYKMLWMMLIGKMDGEVARVSRN